MQLKQCEVGRSNAKIWCGVTHGCRPLVTLALAHPLHSLAHLDQCVKLHENFCLKPSLITTTNSLCTVLKKIYDFTGFIIANSYYLCILFQWHDS